ncbi:MAG: hypothetical protein QGD90_11005, partial [Candidatus Hydrogenedentes bacterium]|nr:hypothetical protein [Candidatus Hydrogenedentota bacterium]
VSYAPGAGTSGFVYGRSALVYAPGEGEAGTSGLVYETSRLVYAVVEAWGVVNADAGLDADA